MSLFFGAYREARSYLLNKECIREVNYTKTARYLITRAIFKDHAGYFRYCLKHRPFLKRMTTNRTANPDSSPGINISKSIGV
ncbi:MAG: hypothetical protein R3B84_03200 [Zavarzinella sp.]